MLERSEWNASDGRGRDWTTPRPPVKGDDAQVFVDIANMREQSSS